MPDFKPWFVIVNPKAGNGKGLKKWPKIEVVLNRKNLNFQYCFTTQQGHSKILIENAIKKGFRKFICVGGDGTLHHIVNGILSQTIVKTSEITVGIIPIGTGNDWVKTYSIPKNIEQAINIIVAGKTNTQDIGKITFLESEKNAVYFINLAGVGFDAYVANTAESLKKFGALSYLIAALKGVFFFKNFGVELLTKTEKISTKSLMTLVGIGHFSGGNMKLTNTPNPKDGLFDITVIDSISKWNMIKNLAKLYNGKINTIKEVKMLKSDYLNINIENSKNLKIQADGEVFIAENISVSIQKNSFRFYCK